MVMSSHQIAAMAQQQTAMFGNQANYAQQITPPGGMFGGYGGGPLPGPPSAGGMQTSYGMRPQGGLMSMAMQMPYQMPGQYISQGFSEQLMGTGLGGLAGGLAGMANIAGGITGAAGLATAGAAGLGAFGIGGGVAGLAAMPMGGALVAAGGLPAMGVALGLGAAAYGGEQLYQGFRERQDVNRVMRQRFGGQMGIGGGRGGMGFNQQEMGKMSTMMREMADQDMFTGFDELTRALDKTGQMGLYRGIENAKEFREKFKKTVSTLKEIAKTMHTSLDEAAGLMEQQRNQGFFSGSDVTASLMRTRLTAGATGMSVQQMQQIGQQGTMMGRSMGMLGRTGSQAMQEMAGTTAMAMQMGILSDEDVAEATGGLTGAAGAQAYAARQMQGNQRWMRRGAGRVMLAGLWDQKGGIDDVMMQRVMSGDVSIGELRQQGRKNIRETGGRRSEFFLDEERLRGQAMAEGGGDLMLGVVGEHFARKKGIELEDPIMKRWLMRSSGKTRAEVELAIKQFRKMPEIMTEKKIRFAQQLEMEGVARAREVSGFQGFRRRIGQMWDQAVSSPIRQAGDDALTELNKGVDDILAQMEGRISMSISERGKEAAIELRSTGKGGILGRGISENQRLMQEVRAKYGGGMGEGGVLAGVGRFLGMRGPGMEERLKGVGAYRFGGLAEDATAQQKMAHLEAAQSQMIQARQNVDISAAEEAELTASITREVLRDQKGAGKVFARGDAAANVDATLQRIGFLEKQSEPFRRLTRGKSMMEKIAIMERGSSRLEEGRMGLGEFGAAGDARLSKLASDKDALDAFRTKTTGDANKFFRQMATKAGTRTTMTTKSRGGRGGVAGGTRVLGEIDVGGLMQIAQGNEQMFKYLETLAGGDTGMTREEAITELQLVGVGEGDDLGVGISREARRTAAAVADAAQKDEKGTAKALEGMLTEEALRSYRVSSETRIQQATKLQSYMARSREEFKESVGKETLSDFQELVRARKGNMPNVEELEDTFLQKHAHTEEGANLLAMLDRDPSGAYQAASIRGLRTWVSRGGKGVLGKGGEQKRAKALLADTLKTFTGKRGLSALGNRREQNRILRDIKSGKISTQDVIAKMREEGEGELGLVKGVTEKQLADVLEQRVAMMGGKGGTTREEFLQLGADLEQQKAQRYRQEGVPEEEQDLPSLAKKQVQHLETMVKLTQMIAKKKGITINVDTKTGKVTDPSGGDTTEE